MWTQLRDSIYTVKHDQITKLMTKILSNPTPSSMPSTPTILHESQVIHSRIFPPALNTAQHTYLSILTDSDYHYNRNPLIVRPLLPIHPNLLFYKKIWDSYLKLIFPCRTSYNSLRTVDPGFANVVHPI